MFFFLTNVIKGAISLTAFDIPSTKAGQYVSKNVLKYSLCTQLAPNNAAGWQYHTIYYNVIMSDTFSEQAMLKLSACLIVLMQRSASYRQAWYVFD